MSQNVEQYDGYITKRTIANNGWYGYNTNLANNGGWLFHQMNKGVIDEKIFEMFGCRYGISYFNWRNCCKP